MLNVRTKIFLLLGGVVVLFVLGMLWMREMDARRYRTISIQRSEERTQSFDQFIQRWGEPLETLSTYYTCWDEMVAAIAASDKAWAAKNLSDSALASYRAHVAWIYRPDGSLFYTRNNLYADTLSQAPVPPQAFAQLLDRGKFCHFFAQTPLGLLEIRGATVHPSRDTRRTTPRQGYFLAGRLWSKADLEEMSLFTDNKISLAAPDPAAPDREVLEGGTVVLSRTLFGWDGAPVARAVVRSESPLMVQFRKMGDRLFLWWSGFAVALLLMLALALRRWVWKPLESFSRALRQEDLTIINPLERDRCEVGDLARLIRNFFGQRENLLREIRDRQVAETALQASEEQLRQATKMEAIGRLAGGVAHDFNNLLTAIIGYGELVRRRFKDDAQGQQDAELILKAAEQAASLTRQLLAFSRKQVLHPRVLDINALVGEVQKLLARVIGEQIELRVELDSHHRRIRADPTQIEQVLLNLAVNARDAMPKGGILTLSTSDTLIPEGIDHEGKKMQPGRYVTLEVSDTGVGMDAETRTRIFEPFYTTKDHGKGTGLGLATVYGIVQQSGGAVLVESVVGKGTTFLVHLPQEAAEPDAATPPPTSLPEPGSTTAATILVVEDEEAVRHLICTVLQECGYRILCSANGREALDLVSREKAEIDLLLTDVVMPQISGPEVARQISRGRPRMKVLFISGYADDAITQGDLDPAAEVLQKPFTPQVLVDRVREVVQGSLPASAGSPTTPVP